jgi:putative polymerase
MISPEKHHQLDRMALLTVSAAIFMNFGLAAVNAHLVNINTTTVILVQLTVTSIAVGMLFIRPPRVPASYYLLLGILLWLALVSLFFHEIYFRFFYDILIIPIFTLLGSTVRTLDIKWLRQLGTVVLIVALIEAILPDFYSWMVNPLGYFLSTRDWVAASTGPAVLPDSGLYVGAMRPGGGVFGVAQHRVGSIFLEPLSLSYFAIISALSFLTYYGRKLQPFILPMLACLFLSLLSDTRTATLILVLLISFNRLFQYTPRYLGIWVPIVIIFVAGVVYYNVSGDGELAYRVGITFSSLQKANLTQIIFGGIDTQRVGDSGLVMLIANAGILGALIYFYIVSGLVLGNRRMIAFSVSVMIFLVSVAIFGGALFSIKTGALLGFITGALSVGAITGGAPSTSAKRRLWNVAMRSPHSGNSAPGRI